MKSDKEISKPYDALESLLMGRWILRWHIECSAMGWKLLENILIYTSRETDLIPVHHSNEVAQNYGAFKHYLVKY